MAHTVTLAPTSVTLQPGQNATVVATISGVPDDASASDVVQVVVGSVTATANLDVVIDNPQPVVSVVSNSGATYQVASPVQTGPGTWECQITVSV
jgi:hypothetical protein